MKNIPIGECEEENLMFKPKDDTSQAELFVRNFLKQRTILRWFS